MTAVLFVLAILALVITVWVWVFQPPKGWSARAVRRWTRRQRRPRSTVRPISARDLTFAEVELALDSIVSAMKQDNFAPQMVVAINRGGAVLGGMLTLRLGMRLENLGYAPLLQLNVNERTRVAVPQGDIPQTLPRAVLLVDQRVDNQTHLDLALDAIRSWPCVNDGVAEVRAAALVCRLASVESGCVRYWGYRYQTSPKIRLPWEAEADSNL
jgi:hypoxanthine phosphoribosyltransferase